MDNKSYPQRITMVEAMTPQGGGPENVIPSFFYIWPFGIQDKSSRNCLIGSGVLDV